MQACPAPDALPPQRSMHTHRLLSSEIVRPVFQRDTAARSAAVKSLKRVDTHSNSSMQLPTLSMAIQQRSITADSAQAEWFLDSHYNSSSRSDDALAVAAVRASKHLRDRDTDQPQPKPKRIRVKTQRRREQCRANQARYRQKQIDLVKKVEETVQKLRADIPILELQRNTLRHGGQQDVWNVVVEYFRLFRFGVLVDLPRTGKQREAHTTNDSGNNIDNAEKKQQLAFLRSSMMEDVNLGERSGVEALMHQWRLYSSSFQNLCLQLRHIQRTTDRFVSVTATLNVTVSESTFENVFPHLKDKFLRSKLLGQHLQVPYSVCFEWDAASWRLSRVETTTNFTTPLLLVLGNLLDVSSVLTRALITRDGAVGINDM
ncbi:bZIP transcription factor 1 [Phytophthora nicotianae]|nr:bZIP transcription factor 1 [Phytophthora nicotianae]